MYEMARVNIKVEPRSTSRLSSTLLPLFYFRVGRVKFTCVYTRIKNFATVEIHPEKEREVREFEIDFKKYFIENDTF